MATRILVWIAGAGDRVVYAPTNDEQTAIDWMFHQYVTEGLTYWFVPDQLKTTVVGTGAVLGFEIQAIGVPHGG